MSDQTCEGEMVIILSSFFSCYSSYLLLELDVYIQKRLNFLQQIHHNIYQYTYLKWRPLKVKWVSIIPVVFTLVRNTSCWVGM